MSARNLGFVIFGTGIAGKVRIRDIRSDGANIGAKLVGYVSR